MEGRKHCRIEEMCSNTSLSSTGGGGDGGGDSDGYGYGVEIMYSNMTKRQRVPKRGPGVAELEKILREQDNITDLYIFKSEPFSTSYKPQPQTTIPPPSNSLPKKYQFPQDKNHISTSVSNATFYSNGTSNTPPGDADGDRVYCGGSGIFMPQNAMFLPDPNHKFNVDLKGPLTCNSGLPFSVPFPSGQTKLLPSPPLIQRSQCSSTSTINLFPLSAVSTSTTPSPARHCHATEPPSNQTSYYHYNSAWPEEEKVGMEVGMQVGMEVGMQMVGTKRPRTFSMKVPQIPSYSCQIPSCSPHVNRLDSSFSCGSGSIINHDPSEAVISRDGKVGSFVLPLPSFTKCHTDNGAVNGNFLLFGSAPINPPSKTHVSPQERSKFITLPPHENTDDWQQRTGQRGSIEKKPFYSFLLPLEQLSKVDHNDKLETRDGIDLNLSL